MILSPEAEKWRLLEASSRSVFFNLATEEAVLQAVGKARSPNAIRLWVNTNSVVLGRFQNPQLEIDFAACKKYGAVIARRLTGGGTVYHDSGNLNYSVYLSRRHRLARDSVVEMFRQTALAVVSGLKNLNVNTEFKAPNSILLGGKKISGMAGAVKWGGILVHGTLLVEANLEIMREVLSPSAVPHVNLPKSVRSVPSEVTNITASCSRASLDVVRRVLRAGFEQAFGIRLKESTLSNEEAALAETLAEKKYSRPDWILRGLSD